jgi:5'-nucleotidase
MRHMTCMRVLLTNDDGADAEGILAIRAALAECCHSVITVAPEADCSGFARRCTFSRPVAVTRVSGGPHPVYRCDGTPTDCVRAGLLGGLAAGADLVVSGINHGANLADDVLYSGTVAAALEAAILGSPAICLSQQTPTGSFSVNYRDSPGISYDFSFAAAHGARLARSVISARPTEPVVLNVNYPAHCADATSVLTRPGRRTYPRTPVSEWPADGDMRRLWLFGRPEEPIQEADASLGTDIGTVRAGHVSVTPLSFAVEISDLSSGLRAFITRLSETFALGLPR